MTQSISEQFHQVWGRGERVVDFSERILRIAQFSLMGALVLAPKTQSLGLRKWMGYAEAGRFGIYALGPARDLRTAVNGGPEEFGETSHTELRNGAYAVCNLTMLLLFLEEYTPVSLGNHQNWVNSLCNGSWMVGAGAAVLNRLEVIGNNKGVATGELEDSSDTEKTTEEKKELSFIDGRLAVDTCDLIYCLAALFATEGKFQAIAGATAGVVGAARMVWPENNE